MNMGYKHDDECLKKVHPEEPIFVLRAQDGSTPKLVMQWIGENIYNVPDEKLREAFEHALKMKDWPVKKLAD